MLVQADAGQIEWRVAVELSNDKIGLEELSNPSLDFHSLNQEAFNLPSRLIAKIYLFRTIYRGSGWAFANDPAFSHVSSDPEFWDEINRKFYNKYDGLNRKHQEWYQTVAEHRPIIGITGRHWLIDFDDKLPINKITNYPVQGTAADLMAIARVSLKSRLDKSGIDAKLISTVHDSIVLDTKEVDKVSQLLYNVFHDLPYNFEKLFKKKLKVPYPCEVKAGHNLTRMSKIADQHSSNRS